MGMYRKVESFLLRLINCVWRWFIIIHEIKNIFKKRKLFANVKLTDEQKKQIDDFYHKNYGKKIPYWWHRLYQSYTGKFDYRYIPEYIFSTRLELLANKRLDAMPYENKNMLSVLFENVAGVRIPQTYVMCVNGFYFDGQRNVISKEQACDILRNKSNGTYNAVIKLTVDTSSGRGVRILQLVEGVDVTTNETIESILDVMGNNFVVQERLRPHESFAMLYPNSINTLRVVSYIVDGKICTAPIVMRIGQGGGVVDNAHAGGMFVGVTNEGKLLKEAFTEYQRRYSVHPDTQEVFEDFQLPCVPEIRNVAIKLHQQLPMLRFISWDFTVDEDGCIVLIEANLHSQTVWFSQMAHGIGFFEENTATMLQIIGK